MFQIHNASFCVCIAIIVADFAMVHFSTGSKSSEWDALEMM